MVGVGRIAQAAHLPWLAGDRERFDLRAVADVSPRLREIVGAKYRVQTYASLNAMLDLELDAIVCATPISMHSETVLKALDAGLHVLCEKPIAFTVRECDEMIQARDLAGRIVQVGYMKRFDPGARRLLAMLPERVEDVQYLSVEVSDPHDHPFTTGLELLPSDVPQIYREELQVRESQQIREAATEELSPEAYRAYRHGYFGSLVHDVNFVHAILEKFRRDLPAGVSEGRFWADGSGVQLAMDVAGGGRANLVHLTLLGVAEYVEHLTLYCADRILELSFPSPYLARRSARLVERQTDGTTGLRTTDIHTAHDDPFRLQLVGFQESIFGIAPAVNTLEQARNDLVVLKKAHTLALKNAHGHPRVP